VNDWQEFSASNASPQNVPFSMAQAAKNTERLAMTWGSSRLRDQKIAFISAGNLKQEEIDAAAVKDQNETTEQKRGDTHSQSSSSQAVVEDNGPVPNPPAEGTSQPTNTFEASNQSQHRRDSILSQSSEEILFTGRNNPAPSTVNKLTPVASKPGTPAPELQPPNALELATPETTAQDSSSSGLEKFENILPPLQNTGADHRGRARQRKKDDEEALVNDYIAHMTFDEPSDEEDTAAAENARSIKAGRRTEHFRFFNQPTEPKVKLRSQFAPNPGQKYSAKMAQAIDWDSADLDDFDEFSTTDEEIVEVSQVLRFRSRPSGRQYLVNPRGKENGDPRWVLHDKLTSASATDEIRIYEEIQLMKIQETTPGSEESDSESDAEDDDDLIDDMESEEEENERILRHTARMTDEQIARALAKQEELGIGGDELLLLDGNVEYGMDGGMDDDLEDAFAQGTAFIPFSTKTHMSSRTTSKRNRRQRDHFPSASAFADALDQDPYGAFDVMDFERPSLKPKKKGRKSDLPFELGAEDSDLAEQLRTTWEKDRAKKAARKREKLAEREDALLDASERNEPAAIKAEIRQFLVQEADKLELAPMDAAQRAAIHRLAAGLKLVSKSQGKEGHGSGRHVVLSKGPRTKYFSIDTIWEVDAYLDSRKFWPKNAFGPHRSFGGAKTRAVAASRLRRGGGGTMSGVSYMNGDVVGASAPEIGADNKGRAMLEKMGWQGGMGLGALGNEGRVDVIKHVVKTTKAGLG
jgi:hypothetical protein